MSFYRMRFHKHKLVRIDVQIEYCVKCKEVCGLHSDD